MVSRDNFGVDYIRCASVSTKQGQPANRLDGSRQRHALSSFKVMILYNICRLVKGPAVPLSDFHLATG
jgi:hypothetical protein